MQDQAEQLDNTHLHLKEATSESFFEAIVTKATTFHMRQDNRLSESGPLEYQYLGFPRTFAHLLKPPKAWGMLVGYGKPITPRILLIKGSSKGMLESSNPSWSSKATIKCHNYRKYGLDPPGRLTTGPDPSWP
jgi:hypothetical protein